MIDSQAASNIVLGIGASNIRYGGGITHITEILSVADPQRNGFKKIIIWGSEDTLAKLPNVSWLEKISPALLNQGLISRVIWQSLILAGALRANKCDVLFAPGGSVIARFEPTVTMSRNLLPFESAELRRFGWSFRALRLNILRSA